MACGRRVGKSRLPAIELSATTATGAPGLFPFNNSHWLIASEALPHIYQSAPICTHRVPPRRASPR